MPVSRTFDGKTVTVHDEDRQRTEIWSRVVGYYRPTYDFNPGKKAELNGRRFYSINEPELSKSPQQTLPL